MSKRWGRNHQGKAAAIEPRSRAVVSLRTCSGRLNDSLRTRGYPHIAPIVRQTCAEFDLPYHQTGSLLELYLSYRTHVRRMGAPQTSDQVLDLASSSAHI